MTPEKDTITVETNIQATPEKVWELWIGPQHIMRWNTPNADWHTLSAEHEVKEGGRFLFRMEEKSGGFGFDYEGIYTAVKPGEYIAYTVSDGRKGKITFTALDNEVRVTETFEADPQNPIDMQQKWGQAVLDSFKNYVEQAA